MREALALADCEQLAFMAHSLKGASATMCAPALREASYGLERAAKDLDTIAAQTAFAMVEAVMAETLAAMRGKLETTQD